MSRADVHPRYHLDYRKYISAQQILSDISYHSVTGMPRPAHHGLFRSGVHSVSCRGLSPSPLAPGSLLRLAPSTLFYITALFYHFFPYCQGAALLFSLKQPIIGVFLFLTYK